MRILIVEDEKRLAMTLKDLLDQSGYLADMAFDGNDGLELAKSGIYDGIILDVMLPGMDGFHLLKRLRAAGNGTPALVLTAKGDLEVRVTGLDAGADYYLTKPFENQELLACLRSILRRQAAFVPECLAFGDLILSPAVSTLSCGEREVTLSARELELLTILFKNTGQFIPKETLLLKIWGYEANVNANSVEAYISFTRKKLALLGSSVTVKAARGIGYRLEETRPEESRLEGSRPEEKRPEVAP